MRPRLVTPQCWVRSVPALPAAASHRGPLPGRETRRAGAVARRMAHRPAAHRAAAHGAAAHRGRLRTGRPRPGCRRPAPWPARWAEAYLVAALRVMWRRRQGHPLPRVAGGYAGPARPGARRPRPRRSRSGRRVRRLAGIWRPAHWTGLRGRQVCPDPSFGCPAAFWRAMARRQPGRRPRGHCAAPAHPRAPRAAWLRPAPASRHRASPAYLASAPPLPSVASPPCRWGVGGSRRPHPSGTCAELGEWSHSRSGRDAGGGHAHVPAGAARQHGQPIAAARAAHSGAARVRDRQRKGGWTSDRSAHHAAVVTAARAHRRHPRLARQGSRGPAARRPGAKCSRASGAVLPRAC